jgi:hypothetical protein
MHKAQHVVDLRLAGHIARHGISGFAITAIDESVLAVALADDADDYLYSGLISFGDALRGIDSGLYTWSTVKLYYSMFYICRAILAYEGHALLYHAKKPISLKCVAGEKLCKRKGTSHEAVLSLFEVVFPTSVLLSQEIELETPLAWLMQKRIDANYKIARFVEPEVSAPFEKIARFGVRKCLASYAEDSSLSYTFDPEHALLALPFLALKEAFRVRRRSSTKALLSPADRSFLSKICSDRAGGLSSLTSLLV